MSFLDNLFGRTLDNKSTFLLESSEKLGDMISAGGKRKTAEMPGYLQRINPMYLEQLYHQDEIIFNGINVLSSVFLSAQYDVLASNDKEKAITQEFMRKVDFPYLLHRIVQDMSVYGNAWLENITDDKDNLITLAILDPKAFDVKRNNDGVALYDEYGFPLSYVQYVSDGTKPPNGMKIINQSDLWGNFYKAIEIPINKLSQFKYHTVGNDPLGIGLVEPMYNVTKAKHLIRQGITQSTQRMGFPLIGFQVGDEAHHPTPDQIADLYSKVEDINERSTFVHAYWIKPYILESKQSTAMQDHIKQYEDAQIATLGIPKSLVTGGGEETNRSTLERQIYIWEKRSRLIQFKIADVIENEIFARLAKQHNFESIPKLVFEDISTESIFGRVERWNDLAKTGLIVPDTELEDYIRDIEHLPPKGDGVPITTPDKIKEGGAGDGKD